MIASPRGTSPLLVGKIFHFIIYYKYVALFLLLGLGLVGLPVPDETLMIFAGYLIYQKKLLFLTSIITIFLGSLSGMTVSFFVGRRLGYPFLKKHGRKFHLTVDRLEKVERWFNRFGKWTVSFGYFIPGIRQLTAISAGISRWSYWTFIFYASIGAFVWVLCFISLGMLFGRHWPIIAEHYHQAGMIGLIVIIIGLGFWLVSRKASKKPTV